MWMWMWNPLVFVIFHEFLRIISYDWIWNYVSYQNILNVVLKIEEIKINHFFHVSAFSQKCFQIQFLGCSVKVQFLQLLPTWIFPFARTGTFSPTASTTSLILVQSASPVSAPFISRVLPWTVSLKNIVFKF